MIQEKDLSKLAGYLDGLGITVPEMWPAGPDFRDADGINVHRLSKEEDATFTYRITIHREEGYRVEGYEAIMTQVPEIRHINLKNGNSADVEKMLQQINWQGMIPELIKEYPDALMALLALSKLGSEKDIRALEISDQLLAKYILGTPMQTVLGPFFEFQQYEKRIHIELNGSADDINTEEARHLLYGRAVSRIDQTVKNAGDELYWTQVRDGELIRLPDFGLHEKLQELPFTRKPDIAVLTEMMMKLSTGARLERSFLVDGKTFRTGFQADPIEGKISFSDKKGNKLSMDEIKQQATEQKEQENRQGKRNGPRL